MVASKKNLRCLQLQRYSVHLDALLRRGDGAAAASPDPDGMVIMRRNRAILTEHILAYCRDVSPLGDDDQAVEPSSQEAGSWEPRWETHPRSFPAMIGHLRRWMAADGWPKEEGGQGEEEEEPQQRPQGPDTSPGPDVEALPAAAGLDDPPADAAVESSIEYPRLGNVHAVPDPLDGEETSHSCAPTETDVINNRGSHQSLVVGEELRPEASASASQSEAPTPTLLGETLVLPAAGGSSRSSPQGQAHGPTSPTGPRQASNQRALHQSLQSVIQSVIQSVKAVRPPRFLAVFFKGNADSNGDDASDSQRGLSAAASDLGTALFVAFSSAPLPGPSAPNKGLRSQRGIRRGDPELRPARAETTPPRNDLHTAGGSRPYETPAVTVPPLSRTGPDGREGSAEDEPPLRSPKGEVVATAPSLSIPRAFPGGDGDDDL